MAKVNIQPVSLSRLDRGAARPARRAHHDGFTNVVNAAPLVREGKLRAFAVSSRKRSVAAPDLPTMVEMGYPDFEAVPWFGLLAPTGTPQAIIDKVHQRDRQGAGACRTCASGSRTPASM